uniref:TRAF-like superfamily protein n=1 Tax=Zea mays TaxID=4577 RepID=A0A804N4Y0_MAIZE
MIGGGKSLWNCQNYMMALLLRMFLPSKPKFKLSDRPFRCLDGHYRRELIRVYLSNVEQVCRRFIDERRSKLSRLIEDKLGWSSFSGFWLAMDPSVRRHMTREKTETILKVIVKQFFIEKEVTSTLVIDSLYSGLKALEYQSKNKKAIPKLTETDARSTPMVLIDQDMFVLADDVIFLLERAALDTLPHQHLPTKDDKSSQNRTKDGNSGQEFSKDSIERDDRRLIELGWKTLELFSLAHIFSRIQVAHQEAVALKRQEELIREEEEAGLAEIELKAKRSAAEKEKRAKKKQAKQKKNSRKGNKGKSGKSNINKEIIMDHSHSDDRILDDFCGQIEEMPLNADNPEEVSDISDSRDDNSDMLHVDIEDRESSPVNWEIDASETQTTIPGSSEVQNDHAGKRTSTVDDSSSSCSSDSVPSVTVNGSYKGGAWTSVRSSSNRGNNRRNKDTEARAGFAQGGSCSSHNGFIGSGSNASGHSKERHEPEDDKVVLQRKQHAQWNIDIISSSKSRMAESSFSSVSSIKKQPQPNFLLESTNSLNHRGSEASGTVTSTTTAGASSTPATQLVLNKGPVSSAATQNEKPLPLQVLVPSKSEVQKQASLTGSATTEAVSVSRPLTAPQVPAAKQSAPVTSTAQNAPFLSRSMSAVGRLGNEPSANAPSFVPRSRTYRNAMMEKSSGGGSCFTHQQGSSEQAVAPWQSMFTSQPFIRPSETLSWKEETLLRSGFTFGTVKPESLNPYQGREENSQQASSNSSDCAPSSSNIRSEIEKLNLSGRPRSKQLLSEISTRFTPYQPQGLVADEFPHLDIINDLLDEEQSDRRRVLQPDFVQQSYMPHGASTPDYGEPYLFDQSEQYFDEEPPRFYSPLSSAPRRLRDLSYSHFDLPSHSSSSQFDDLMMSQWPYSRTDISMPSFGSDTSGYPYQVWDLANGSSRYPSYRPANGH